MFLCVERSLCSLPAGYKVLVHQDPEIERRKRLRREVGFQSLFSFLSSFFSFKARSIEDLSVHLFPFCTRLGNQGPKQS